jgi:3',5'-cyclic-AMP phosphodiesterase
MKNKYLCYSDTHLNFTFPWTKYRFVNKIAAEQAAGLFLPGDIACGLTIKQMLAFLAKKLDMPIYFVIGNHDSYGTSFQETHSAIRDICNKYSHLIWLTDHEVIKLNHEACLIGDDGWYDARLGNLDYIAYNFDWMTIKEFRLLKSFDEKLTYSRQLADQSTAALKNKLEKALETYQTVYIMTHMPPWREAVRGLGTELEAFWLPYSINFRMGEMIEEVMRDRGNQNVIILSGHTHTPAIINVSHNIECVVQNGKYLGSPTEHNCVFI